MTLDELIKTPGEWLRGSGPQSDIVVSSRVRLARNLADYPFLTSAGASERTEICRHLSDIVSRTPVGKRSVFVDLEQADTIDQQVLVERHLISRQHAAGEGSRGVVVSDDETHAVMINEEDHLRMQAFRSGLQLEALWEDLNIVDDSVAEHVAFAFDRQFGYLTACPTNVGTGLRVSVMLHLPALKMTRDIERVARAARDMHLAVRGLHGEGTEAIGDLYQISNQATLGKSEEGIVRTFEATIIPKIVEYERAARESLVKHNATALDDKVWRAFGILSHARRISSEETQSLLSPIRLGINMGRFHAIDIQTLNELFLFTQPAHLQKLHGKELADDDRDVARAEFLRKRLAKPA
jgi:protein arginine kinase